MSEVVKAKDNRPIAPEINGFGHEIVSALGVLVIRTSHHELVLRSLLEAVADFSGPQAWALFHVTSSSKARLDSIHALSNATNLSDETVQSIHDVLDAAKRLADERNVFIHWEYSIRPHPLAHHPAKPVLVGNMPRSKRPFVERPFAAKDIWELTDRYGEVNRLIVRVRDQVRGEYEGGL